MKNKITKNIYHSLTFILTSILVFANSLSHANNSYPNQSIRLIGAFSAGSSTDTVARFLAEGLTKQLKQTVIVENKPGANTAIGTTLAANAAPDGYTLSMIFVENMIINPIINKDLRYSPKDLDPVAIVGQIPLVLLASPDLPYDTINELQLATKEENKIFNLGTWGNGSVAHVIGAMVEKKGNLKFNYIPFSGSAPSINALIGGHIDLAVSTPTTAAALISSKKAKAIAIASPYRVPGLPDTETFTEAGLENIGVTQWHGLAVKSNGNEEIINKISKVIEKTYEDQEFLNKISGLGYIDIGGMSPSEYKVFIEDQTKIWSEAIKESGITQ